MTRLKPKKSPKAAYQGGMEIIRKNYIAGAPLNQGVGQMQMHILTSPFVEVAGDGKSAQALWYSPGQVTVKNQGKAEALWVYGLYGADFLNEDGEWKIWHLFLGTDFAFEAGSDYTQIPVDELPSDLEYFGKPELTHAFEAYTSRYNYSLYPPIPKPYESFSDPQVISNGPEGNPVFNKEGN